MGKSRALSAAELKARFEGAKLCSVPQDGFWLDTLFEPARTEPSLILLSLEIFVGRSVTDEIYRLIPPKCAHRTLPDAIALLIATLEYIDRTRQAARDES